MRINIIGFNEKGRRVSYFPNVEIASTFNLSPGLYGVTDYQIDLLVEEKIDDWDRYELG